MNIHQNKILILDFGSQYTQLIARRIRDIGVYCEIFSCHASEEAIQQFAPSGIILSGGPETVTDETTPRAPDIIFKMNCPVLGICYGMHTMAVQLDGKVAQGQRREFGYAKVTLPHNSALFHQIEDHIDDSGFSTLDVWMSHGDDVSQLPKGFTVTASTGKCAIVGMEDDLRHFYGIQFHPEVSHTPQGKRILERFVVDICQCTAQWTTQNIISDLIAQIKKTVGDEQVILGLSGGVDSSVVAALLHKAIGKQLTCVFVDHGLLRLNEAQHVQNIFAKHFGIDLITVSAEELFLKKLSGETDPETKRKIIGKLFIEIFEKESKKINNATWLAQGTIYSDVIESADSCHGKAHLIKSHHNVGGLPEKMQLKLIEPLRELFKDEVIKLGLELGLPPDVVFCHPFPGPGLAVRILGEVKKNAIEILQKADAIFIEELRSHDLYHKVNQAFAVFLPVKSVGVLGDARHYDFVIALRAVETIDFMTARWAHLPQEFLGKVSHRIVNEVRGISRVVYDITGKPPATVEWE